MGSGFDLKCRKCGYRFEANLGIGFSFPRVYRDTMKAAMDGKYGEEVRRFLMEHPDGALDCSRVLLRCGECGALDSDMDLSMYLPEEKGKPEDYIPWASWTGMEGYKLVRRYAHRCKRCGCSMNSFHENELDEVMGCPSDDKSVTGLRCPDCGDYLRYDSYCMWD